jgi:hypothetical protein
LSRRDLGYVVAGGEKCLGCRWLFAQADAVRLQRNPIDRGGAKHVKVAGAPRAAGQVWRLGIFT